MQISQQHRRAGPPVGEETYLVSQGLRFVSERVANPGRNRNGEHDSEGTSEPGSQGRRPSASTVHRQAIRDRRLKFLSSTAIPLSISAHSNFATEPRLGGLLKFYQPAA